MKKLLAVMIVGIFMLGSGLAFAKEMQCRCQCAPDNKMEQNKENWQAKRLDRMAKELDLTTEQREKVAVVMDKAREEMQALRVTSEKNIKAVLTPEQAKKFDELKAGMQKRMGERKGKRIMEPMGK